jgi:hypothetical protein
MKSTLSILLVVAVALMAGCNQGPSNENPVGGVDGGIASSPDCVAAPVSSTDLLNGCTTSQTGDPAKDYPYFPKLAPEGVLPSLP